MNKKELSEIRKNFSETSDLFVLNQVATAFVDSEKTFAVKQAEPITISLLKKATASWPH